MTELAHVRRPHCSEHCNRPAPQRPGVDLSRISSSLRDAAGLMNLSRKQRIRMAVFSSFSERTAGHIELLSTLSPREWSGLLDWLDVSGLALYWLDRLVQLGLHSALPQAAIDRLQRNLDDNTVRTRGMIDESVSIQHDFQTANLSYAVMKGISLSPVSVPRPELRHQFDLDYLIEEKDAPEARRILERRGYRLYAISGKSWEFKIHETPHVSRKDLYKDLPYRGVELHLESGAPGQDSRLGRVIKREMFGIAMPVFSPTDLFLSQAQHAFKDLCSAFARASHLLEFYRHVLARHDDQRFWNELRIAAEGNRRTCIAVGAVTYLTGAILDDLDDSVPQALTAWTVKTLPSAVRLWLDLYGRRAVVAAHPGTKLHLLLKQQLEAAEAPGKQQFKNVLLPSRLPPAVIRASAGETLWTRIVRYRVQVRFLLSRFRFHIVEGTRYATELYRWRRHLDQLAR